MSRRDDILLKVRSLLALGEDKRGNEHEASNAMELAARLMAEYGISSEEARRADDDAPTVCRGTAFVMEHAWQDRVADAAARLYGARPLWLDVYGHRNGKRIVVGQEMSFFGRAEIIDAAQATYLFIIDQVETMYRHALPTGMTKDERAKYRRSFKNAAAVRVQTRVTAIVKKIAAELPASQSTALTIIDYRQQLDNEINETFEKLGVKQMKAVALKSSHDEAMNAGFRAGDAIQIQKTVK